MTALLTLLSYLATFFLGAGFACLLIAALVMRAARSAEQPRRTVRGGDGADLDVTGVMDSVSEHH